MPTTFTFVDEPPPYRRGGLNPLREAFAIALRERPGEWALSPEKQSSNSTAYGFASNIRLGKLLTFPAGEFEARTSECDVYVRYIGDT